MKIAYADPPYPSRNPYRYYESQVANHRLLIAYLEEFDGWALSTSSAALVTVSEWLPEWTRCAAWVRQPGRFSGGAQFSWEPVLYRPARANARAMDSTRRTGYNSRARFLGAKPEEFCYWMFDLLGANPDDEFVDVFPGSGAVTAAWEKWCNHRPLPLARPEQLAGWDG
jgi:hypothetical protein